MTSPDSTGVALIEVAAVVHTAEGVADLVVELSTRLAGTVDPAPSTLVVCASIEGPEPLMTAAVEAVRGFVHCAALDLAAAGTRVNLVLRPASVDPAGAISYLVEGGGATALGMTIDLRS